MISKYEDEIFVGLALFIVLALATVAFAVGIQGFPTDNRECVSWETSREWVVEAKPMVSTGSGMGVGMDGSVGTTFSNSSAGNITYGVGGSWEDVEKCTEWALLPTPEG